MSDHEQDNREPGQRLAQDAVRSLGVPAADPAFRERLKAQFVAGAVPAQPAFADSTPARPRPRPRRLVAVYGWGTLAAAAVVAFAVCGLNRLPGPQLVAVNGTGSVIMDDEVLAAGSPDLIAARLHPGARLRVDGDTSLDLQYPGAMMWRLEPGTDVVLPDRPGRWFGRSCAPTWPRARSACAPARTCTGANWTWPPRRAPPRSTAPSSTSCSNDELTCFCLHDGTAHVSLDGRDLGAIPPMMRRVIFTDGRPPELSDIAPPHLEHMLELDRDMSGRFEPR